MDFMPLSRASAWCSMVEMNQIPQPTNAERLHVALVQLDKFRVLRKDDHIQFMALKKDRDNLRRLLKAVLEEDSGLLLADEIREAIKPKPRRLT